MIQGNTPEHADSAEGTVRIREWRESDLLEILQIVHDSPTAPQWNEVHFREMLGAASGPSAALVRTIRVAESAAGFAGFAVASALKVVYPSEAELESIAVTPAMRGQGIGRTLAKAVVDWAGANGADEIRLEVRASNHSAFGLYRALGFHETGVRRGYYANPPEDAICMVYTISPNAVDDVRGR